MHHELQMERFGVRPRPVRMEGAPFIVWLGNLDHVNGRVGDSAQNRAPWHLRAVSQARPPPTGTGCKSKRVLGQFAGNRGSGGVEARKARAEDVIRTSLQEACSTEALKRPPTKKRQFLKVRMIVERVKGIEPSFSLKPPVVFH